MMALLRETVRQAKKAGSGVVFVHAPRWSDDFQTEKVSKTLLENITAVAAEEDIPFLCLTQENSPDFRTPALFADTAHLNEEGSQLFSQIVANWILELKITGMHF